MKWVLLCCEGQDDKLECIAINKIENERTNQKKFFKRGTRPLRQSKKITSKLNDLMMKMRRLVILECKKTSYHGFPDSIVLMKQKNYYLTKEPRFVDGFYRLYLDQIEATFVKENILGSNFRFQLKRI
jgi:hypothetical protein